MCIGRAASEWRNGSHWCSMMQWDKLSPLEPTRRTRCGTMIRHSSWGTSRRLCWRAVEWSNKNALIDWLVRTLGSGSWGNQRWGQIRTALGISETSSRFLTGRRAGPTWGARSRSSRRIIPRGFCHYTSWNTPTSSGELGWRLKSNGWRRARPRRSAVGHRIMPRALCQRGKCHRRLCREALPDPK